VQEIGGKVALIVNYNDADVSKIVMSDDGTGRDIHIPALLISKKDGDILKEYIKNAREEDDLKRMQILLDFDLVNLHSSRNILKRMLN
jgi:hypothetical protein